MRDGSGRDGRRRRAMWALSVVMGSLAALAAPVSAGGDTGPAPAPELAPQVIGGDPVLNDGFVVALLTAAITDPFLAQFCAGSLVAPDVVVTAAHCVADVTADRIEVAAGVTRLSSIAPGDRVGVAEIVVHPGWDPTSFASVDLALVRLARPVTGIDPVPIESDPVEPSQGRSLVVAGWGAVDTAGSVFPDGLRAAAVRAQTSVTTPPEVVDVLCGSLRPGNTVCLGGPTTGVCSGDSGGPVLGETAPGSGVLELEAVVSYGPLPCLSPVAYDGGQRLSPYRPWIDHQMTAWAPAPAVPPGAPGAPRVSRTGTSAIVSWSPPFDDGGAELVYTVVGVPGGYCVAITTSCVIEGLSIGVPHTFTVTAANTAGFGPPSPPSTAVLAAVVVDCSSSPPHPFGDVGVSSFAFGDVGCLYGLGVTTGVGGGLYGPDRVVTREQMAAFLARLYRVITRGA